MLSLPRKTAAVVALGSLAALAPVGASPAGANHESYGNNAIVCYVKSRDYIRCFHAGPLAATQFPAATRR